VPQARRQFPILITEGFGEIPMNSALLAADDEWPAK
jgi:hypothetical protein